jgi:hypothetical protein
MMRRALAAVSPAPTFLKCSRPRKLISALLALVRYLPPPSQTLPERALLHPGRIDRVFLALCILGHRHD